MLGYKCEQIYEHEIVYKTTSIFLLAGWKFFEVEKASKTIVQNGFFRETVLKSKNKIIMKFILFKMSQKLWKIRWNLVGNNVYPDITKNAALILQLITVTFFIIIRNNSDFSTVQFCTKNCPKRNSLNYWKS